MTKSNDELSPGTKVLSLEIGETIHVPVENKHTGYAIQIDKELESSKDKPMYEGTIDGTNIKCIIKLYNNTTVCDNYESPLTLNGRGIYRDCTFIPFSQADVTLKGIPLIEYCKTLENHEKFTLMYQLLAHLNTIHEIQLGGRHIHNDIKPDNIVVYDNYPYFIDYEASKSFSRYEEIEDLCYDSSNRVLTSLSGTNHYNPPEKLNSTKNFISPKSDIYSLGLVFMEMLSNNTRQDITNLKMFGDVIFDLINKMTDKTRKERPTAIECLQLLGVVDKYESYLAPSIAKPKTRTLKRKQPSPCKQTPVKKTIL